MPSILVAEDDPTIRNIYGYTFAQEGFAVTLASSGAEALVRARAKIYDAILLDMVMMEGSGLDFLRTYNIRKLAPQTVVVGLSNIDNPEVVDRAKQLGVQHYLVKSNYDPGQVVAFVKARLQEVAGK